jgi:hypothetical protein
MPECKRCQYVGASADLRRSPTDGYLCNDKTACERRRLAGLSNWEALTGYAAEAAQVASKVLRATEDGDSMEALRRLRQLHFRSTDLAAELAGAASREGHTQKDIADALGVPASTLRGLKQAAAEERFVAV